MVRKICNESIAAGIVVYNPDETERLMKCLESILQQVERVYVFDNSTQTLDISFPKEVVYQTEHNNLGIAFALNRIMEQARNDGYTWVITMDQDSVLPNDLVSEYKKNILEPDVGIICPQVIDSRRAYMEINKEPAKEYIDECITSGSCTSVEIWERVGGFDEWLFIDLVDNEFCKRLVVSGYKILRLNKLVINQEFGKIIPKSYKEQQFWIRLSKILHNPNVAKFSYKKFVSAMRVYYTNRNIIYVNRKMRNYGPTAYGNYNCKGYIGFLVCFCVPSILRAQDKKKVIKAIVNGIRDGRKAKVMVWKSIEKS